MEEGGRQGGGNRPVEQCGQVRVERAVFMAARRGWREMGKEIGVGREQRDESVWCREVRWSHGGDSEAGSVFWCGGGVVVEDVVGPDFWAEVEDGGGVLNCKTNGSEKRVGSMNSIVGASAGGGSNWMAGNMAGSPQVIEGGPSSPL